MRINDLATQMSATPELFARRAEEASQGVRQLAEGQPSNLVPASVSERMEQALAVANDRLQNTEASLQQVTAGRDVQQDTQATLRDLNQVLERAQQQNLSADEQSELQERFDRTLEDLDRMEGRLQQATVGSGQDFPSLSSEQLGSGSSTSFANIAALRDLNLASADSSTLSNAAAVASAASEAVDRAVGASERRGADLAQQRDIFAGVVEALGGAPRNEGSTAAQPFDSASDPRLAPQAQAVQSFIQQLQGGSGSNPLMMPGSFLNFSA